MEKGRPSTRDDYLFLVVGALELWSCRVDQSGLVGHGSRCRSPTTTTRASVDGGRTA